MKLNDPVRALLYHHYREGQRLAPAPHSPPIAGVLALLGIVVTVIALGAFLWVAFTLSSIF